VLDSADMMFSCGLDL